MWPVIRVYVTCVDFVCVGLIVVVVVVLGVICCCCISCDHGDILCL